jgi:hypothetical protein
MGVRKLAVLLSLLPVAARAQSAWEEGQWAGDDQYSSQPWDDADAREGAASAQPQYETPPPPPDDEYAAPQYDPRPPVEPYAAPQYTPPSPPVDEYADAGPSMDDFRSGLRPYGRWVQSPEYGWVWQPRHVSHEWRPYWDGHWVWTTAGWTWVTDEPWGWATYHYGRWAMVAGAGWVWVPGRVWAPAWVAWRWGGGYAGWCPLGPRGVVYVQPRSWVFVASPNFLAPVRHHAVPFKVVTTIWTRAQPLPVVRPTPRAGPLPRIVEEHTHVPVRVVPIVEAGSRTQTRPLATGAVPVWRPRTIPYVRPGAVANPPEHAERPRVVSPGGNMIRGEPRALPADPRVGPVYRVPVQTRLPNDLPGHADRRPEQPPGLERRPTQPPGQERRPTEPPGQERRPEDSPRADRRPEQLPGQERRPQETPRADRRPEQLPGQERRPEQLPGMNRRPEQGPHAEQQRPPAMQPARPPPPAAAPARREHDVPARPAAEPHARPVEAKRDRERD